MSEHHNQSDESKDIHQRIDEVIDSVNQRVNDALGQINEKIEELGGKPRRKSRKQRDNTFWGLVLIVVGFFWLAGNLDWFHLDIPFWPVVIIVVGLYLLVESRS